jgi:EAL domain-containing protein (putative c-di-GMP-specific phosphodiesterase class I)
MPYKKICFDIIENMVILVMDETLEFINTFQKWGYLFASDDFSSGFSSYNYLKNLSVDQIKIDCDFVKDILVDPVNIAKNMGTKTVAEFVESTEIILDLGKVNVYFI